MTISGKIRDLNDLLKKRYEEFDAAKAAELEVIQEGDLDSRTALEEKYERLRLEEFQKTDLLVKELKKEEQRLLDLEESATKALDKAGYAEESATKALDKAMAAANNVEDAEDKAKAAGTKADSAKRRGLVGIILAALALIAAGLALYLALVNKDQADKIATLDNQMNNKESGVITVMNSLGKQLENKVDKAEFKSLVDKVSNKETGLEALAEQLENKVDKAEFKSLVDRINDPETGLDTKISEARAQQIFSAQCEAEKAAQEALREKRRLAQLNRPPRPTLEQTIVKVVEEHFDVHPKESADINDTNSLTVNPGTTPSETEKPSGVAIEEVNLERVGN